MMNVLGTTLSTPIVIVSGPASSNAARSAASLRSPFPSKDGTHKPCFEASGCGGRLRRRSLPHSSFLLPNLLLPLPKILVHFRLFDEHDINSCNLSQRDKKKPPSAPRQVRELLSEAQPARRTVPRPRPRSAAVSPERQGLLEACRQHGRCNSIHNTTLNGARNHLLDPDEIPSWLNDLSENGCGSHGSRIQLRAPHTWSFRVCWCGLMSCSQHLSHWCSVGLSRKNICAFLFFFCSSMQLRSIGFGCALERTQCCTQHITQFVVAGQHSPRPGCKRLQLVVEVKTPLTSRIHCTRPVFQCLTKLPALLIITSRTDLTSALTPRRFFATDATVTCAKITPVRLYSHYALGKLLSSWLDHRILESLARRCR